jgi:L-serine dehydratase
MSNSMISNTIDNSTPKIVKVGLVSVADLFKIGIGPSSSHTIGPMRAASLFLTKLSDVLSATDRLVATAYGSLALTGKGHATDKAMILGFAGEMPDNLDPDCAEERYRTITETQQLVLPSGKVINFCPATDVVFDTVRTFERHPNAMSFEALDARGKCLRREMWFSIGGGFVESEDQSSEDQSIDIGVLPKETPFPFHNGTSLLEFGRVSGLSIVQMVLANEGMHRPQRETLAAIDNVASAMFACIDRGLKASGELPGGLKIKRRAKMLYEKLETSRLKNERTLNEPMSYVSAFAIAVNEQNAAGGRVVTAPTNGAAGVVPAVLRYYRDFCSGADCEGIYRFFLAATAIGGVIKRNASISGAEVGCQGEVGSAAAMAAGGLVSALGGTNEQVENAAESAMEHHLGMTCDPVGGLVQIPCIERNAFGAVKAIAAASLALQGDGTHHVSLDQVVETMRQTGADMSSKYRETSRGGLAVNVPEC